jgi:hypothetical protein
MRFLLLGALLCISCQAGAALQEQEIDVTVLGFESASAPAPKGEPELVPGLYDTVIVGARHERPHGLLVAQRPERDPARTRLPGRRPGLPRRHRRRDRLRPRVGVLLGAAENVMPFYKEMGLTPIEQTAIPSPIDAYFRSGSLVNDMWEDGCFKQLPKEFKAFHKALLKDDKAGKVASQPIDKAEDLSLDRISAAEYLKPYGKEVKAFLDSYCQSALGCFSEDVSAMAFTNFYTSESAPATPGRAGPRGRASTWARCFGA